MASDPSASEPSLFEWLTDDLLVSVLLPFLAPGRTRPSMLAAVNLSSTCKNLRARLDAPIAVLRAQLPPPYTAAALDEALASGDAEAATPLLQEAMRRLGRNLEKINGRLLDRGYPVATSCALSGRRYLAPMEDLDERVAALRERGLEVPLVLLELWRSLGGFALAVRLRPAFLFFISLVLLTHACACVLRRAQWTALTSTGGAHPLLRSRRTLATKRLSSRQSLSPTATPSSTTHST